MVPSSGRPFPPKQGRDVVVGPVDAVAVGPVVGAIVAATVVGVRSSESLLVAAAALVALVALLGLAGPWVAFGGMLAPVARKAPSEVEMLDYCMPSAVRSCSGAFPAGLSCWWRCVAVLVD